VNEPAKTKTKEGKKFKDQTSYAVEENDNNNNKKVRL